MTEGKLGERIHCRDCGGVRWHVLHAKEDRKWHSDDTALYGSDSWQILECAGCNAMTLRHQHWFSEDAEGDGRPIVHDDLYPPASPRKKPEWFGELWLCCDPADIGMIRILEDSYSVMGLRSFALASMGIRSVVDFIVTKKAGDHGKFRSKLERLVESGLITSSRVDIVYSAFDAGSASSHRAYMPTESDLFTMFEIAERLIYDIVVKPYHELREKEAADKLRARTPPRR